MNNINNEKVQELKKKKKTAIETNIKTMKKSSQYIHNYDKTNCIICHKQVKKQLAIHIKFRLNAELPQCSHTVHCLHIVIFPLISGKERNCF